MNIPYNYKHDIIFYSKVYTFTRGKKSTKCSQQQKYKPPLMSIILEWTNCGIRIHKIEYSHENEQTTIPHGLTS